jgi:hypothetical protein
MESGILHELCQREGIACATLRVISDSALEDLTVDFCARSNPTGQFPFRLWPANSSSIPEKSRP